MESAPPLPDPAPTAPTAPTGAPVHAAAVEQVYAELRDCSDRATTTPAFAGRVAGFGHAEAWQVAARLRDWRIAAGYRPVGRKIGFTNRTIWPRYGVYEPIWAHVYDRTVQFAAGNAAAVDLGGLVQPRIEPEIAFRLARPIAGPTAAGGPEAILAAVEWVAPAFEVVHCHFPDWRLAAADGIADFSLHGALVIGTPVPVAALPVERWREVLETAGVTLSCGGTVRDRGVASNVLDGPLHALCYLVGVLSGQPAFSPLAAGEIVTTGTITDAHPVRPGETWSSLYDGVALAGLTIRFC